MSEPTTATEIADRIDAVAAEIKELRNAAQPLGEKALHTLLSDLYRVTVAGPTADGYRARVEELRA